MYSSQRLHIAATAPPASAKASLVRRCCSEVEAKSRPLPLSMLTRPAQAIFGAIWSIIAVILTWAAAGAPWAISSDNGNTYSIGLAYFCVSGNGGSNWSTTGACAYYSSGLPSAACALLSIGGLFGFFGIALHFLCNMCSRRCDTSCIIVVSVLTFLLCIAGTVCGGVYFTQNLVSYSLWLSNNSIPGYALAVTSTVMWFVAIFITVAETCALERKPTPPVDPSAFSGTNPNARANV